MRSMFAAVVILFCLGAVLAPLPAAGDVFVLHSFTGGTFNGERPMGGLAISGETLYGATRYGGASDDGTVFSYGLSSGFQILRSLSFATTGQLPRTGLTRNGSTLYGGLSDPGSLYSINTDGGDFQQIVVLPTRDGPLSPTSDLMIHGSNIYGIASDESPPYRETYRAALSGGSYDVMHSFNAGNPHLGSRPVGKLTTDGTSVFGVARTEGPGFAGLIYKIPLTGPNDYDIVFDFDGSGTAGPRTGLTLVGDTLYGMTETKIYKVDTDGTDFEIIHAFTGGAGGSTPAAALTYTGTQMLGTTKSGGDFDGGTLFRIALDGSGFEVLHSFGAPGDGRLPTDGAVIYDAPLVWGLTSNGGSDDLGTIWLAIVVPEPSSFVLCGAALLGLAAFGLRRPKR